MLERRCKRLVAQQQGVIERTAQQLDHRAKEVLRCEQKLENHEQKIERHEQTITRERARVESKQSTIERLQEQLRRMQQHRFGQRSEKDPNQSEFHWFNEAKLLAEQALHDEVNDGENSVEVPGHRRKKARSRQLPADLPRTEVVHDLSDQDGIVTLFRAWHC